MQPSLAPAAVWALALLCLALYRRDLWRDAELVAGAAGPIRQALPVQREDPEEEPATSSEGSTRLPGLACAVAATAAVRLALFIAVGR